jgi:hypothetical protein
MKKEKISIVEDQSGQVAGTFALIIIVIVSSLAFMALGYVFDALVLFNTEYSVPGFVVCQQRADAINLLSRFFYAMPVLITFIIIIYTIKVAISRHYQEV